MKPRLCKYCGKEFIPTYGSVKYCSDYCRHMGQILSQRKYYNNNRDDIDFKARRHEYWTRKHSGGNVNEKLD